MAITPGKCPPTGCPPFTYKDCIKVKKVFDQCTTYDFLAGSTTVTPQQGKTVTIDSCTPPDPKTLGIKTEIDYDDHTPWYATVKVWQWGTVKAKLTGATETTKDVPVMGYTETVMWVPPGTEVDTSIFNLSCHCAAYVGPTGTATAATPTPPVSISCELTACKEIQVTAWVKLLVPSYGYCEFPPCEQTDPCPPPPTYQPQLCQEEPVVIIRGATGTGVGGIAVTLSRASTPSASLTATTDATGTAVFAGAGGFAGGYDTITFTYPTGKSVSFELPVEFTGADGNLHDSATACQIEFDYDIVSNKYSVIIDGVPVAGQIDP